MVYKKAKLIICRATGEVVGTSKTPELYIIKKQRWVKFYHTGKETHLLMPINEFKFYYRLEDER